MPFCRGWVSPGAQVLQVRHVCSMLMSLASALPAISLAPPAARKALSFPFHLGAGLWGNRAFRRRRSLSVGVNTQQGDEDTRNR